MLPWEHAAVGYLAYSLWCHVVDRRSPGALEAIAALVGSQLPDLIDKPLSWQYGVFDSGYALGHSIFFAVPVAVGAGLLARTYGRGSVGVALVLGYLLHLPGDLVEDVLREGELVAAPILWPVVTAPPSPEQPVVGVTVELFYEYVDALTAPDPPTFVLVQAGVIVGTALLWLYDGAPVLRELLVGVRRRLGHAVGDATN
ncbi:LexA-binding, inner membrane-associated putative hydrolase [Natronoarchaeum philippinense]|uniref:LexA-binding, inner membrane-associated putative hydrolase n=1 Tax=Natronoarchaeum philippinense TaxID=558529 RepID=A0A285NB56_NATPI|nr:metal-dependent hydrolase [Natronoarchaeum philippinense]SNZ05196.1 LexA-binding, inner membrane-associated putative hydrolase [Natronoarchaeum philippinense]